MHMSLPPILVQSSPYIATKPQRRIDTSSNTPPVSKPSHRTPNTCLGFSISTSYCENTIIPLALTGQAKISNSLPPFRRRLAQPPRHRMRYPIDRRKHTGTIPSLYPGARGI
jgi:hypothetical protein